MEIVLGSRAGRVGRVKLRRIIGYVGGGGGRKAKGRDKGCRKIRKR